MLNLKNVENPKLQTLPIDGFIPEILGALEKHNQIILVAPPGTGKTTRVPWAVLDSLWKRGLTNEEVIVLEPRKLAAKMTALRVSEERGLKIGEDVGYQFRGERQGGASTRLWYYTEGVLLRRLLSDPMLKGVNTVILDEFHERHINTDLALALINHLQKTSRPDLRLIVMSATLDTESLGSYLKGARKIEVPAEFHKVEIQYLESKNFIEDKVLQALKLCEGKGDVLIFLSGMAEILKVEKVLQGKGKILKLHGELTKEEQALAFEKSKETKIILSTNIAETSVTIPGVRCVIDGGTHRQMSFSWWSGVGRLVNRGISKASAIQRAGRAGREAPGFSVRLYSKLDFDQRVGFEKPEILRSDLSSVVLQMVALGISDLQKFQWFEKPEESFLQTSVDLLRQIGALKKHNHDSEYSKLELTSEGLELSRLPLHPRIAACLLSAKKKGILPEMALFSALYEQDGFDDMSSSKKDLFTVLKSYRASFISRRVMKEYERIFQLLDESHIPVEKIKFTSESDFQKCLLSGFLDRVAKVTLKGGKTQFQYAFGGSSDVRNDGGIFHNGQALLIIDALEKTTQGKAGSYFDVKLWSEFKEEWLFDIEPSPVAEVTELFYDKEKERVFSREGLYLGKLALSESVIPAKPSVKSTAVLLREGLSVKEPSSQLSFKEQWNLLKNSIGGRLPCEEIESYFVRADILKLDFLSQGPFLLLSQILGEMSSLSQFEERHIKEKFLDLLPYEMRPQFFQWFPEFLPQLPHQKKRIRVNYSFDKEPYVESRLQDFWGLQDTPKIYMGRIALTVHMLAPNGRAVQVTKDLASFSKNTYPEVKKELS